MTFEKPQSIDEIKRSLEAGEIKRGDKGEKIIELTDDVEGVITMTHSPELETLTYTVNNVTSEVTIREGVVVNIELFHPHTGNAIYDNDLRLKRRSYIQNLLDGGKIDLT